MIDSPVISVRAKEPVPFVDGSKRFADVFPQRVLTFVTFGHG